MFFDTWSISQPDRCHDDPRCTKDFHNKAGLRELRFGIAGTGYEAYDYRVEFILQDGGQTLGITDLWIGAKNMPALGYLRVGHYNLETSLAYLIGSTQTTGTKFLAPSGAFNLGRRFGISSEHLFAQDRIRWFGGFFQGQPTHVNRSYHSDYQGYILNTRLSAVPYYASGGRSFLHFGGHYSFIDAKPRQATDPPTLPAASNPGVSMHAGGSGWGIGETLRMRSIRSRHQHRSGLELAYQHGPLSVMSEAFFAQYGAADGHNLARGASLELAYFLTGDHRAYNLAAGTIGAVQMKRPFTPFKSGGWNLVNGPGAWQVYTQYAYVDLTDWREGSGRQADRYGGYQHDLTLGVNWFWTSNLRWMLEYTHSQQNTGSDRKYCYQDILGASVRVNW